MIFGRARDIVFMQKGYDHVVFICTVSNIMFLEYSRARGGYGVTNCVNKTYATDLPTMQIARIQSEGNMVVHCMDRNILCS